MLVLLNQLAAKLISVIEFARHGARQYRDPNRTTDEEAELTDYGYYQNKLFAANLKNNYPEIFNEHLDHADVRVVTSSRSRCALSALGQILEMFKHNHTSEENTLDMTRQNYKSLVSKFDVDVLSKEENIVFKSHKTDCKYLQNTRKTDVIRSEHISPYYEYLDTHFNRQKFNATAYLENRTNEIHHFSAIYDLVHSFKSFNNTQAVEEHTFNYMRAFKMYVRLQEKYYNTTITTYHVQNILIEILTSVDDILTGYTRNEPYKKFILFVGHDSNIVPLLNIFKLTSIECLEKALKDYDSIEERANCQFYPEFLANFLFELHQEGTQYYIVAKYNGKVFSLCNGRDRCPLFDLRRMLFNSLQRNYTEYCIKGTNSQLEKQKTKERKLNKGMMILATLVGSLIVIRRIKEGKIFKND